MGLKKLITDINEILKWEPNNIFYKSYLNNNFKWRTTNTKLGSFMKLLPVLIEICIKGIYYIITWPLYLIVKLIWLVFIGICFPQKWFE